MLHPRAAFAFARFGLLTFVVGAVAAASACGDEETVDRVPPAETDAGTTDGSADAAADGAVTADAGTDSSATDANVDPDTASDATADVSVDSPNDAAADVDAGPYLPSSLANGIAAGRLHTCAVTIAGSARCWGYSEYGQLGEGTVAATSTPYPVQVTGLTAGVTQISSHLDHTCVVASGGAKCWGANDSGQLGNASTTHSGVPVPVSGLTSGVAAVAAGFAHTCALTSGGAVKCWGFNGAGRLGNDTTDDSDVPVDVTGLSSGAKAVAAGRTHSCAITSANGMKCWGANTYGQLGDDSNSESYVPVDVTGLTSGVAAIAVGDEVSCAITTAGALKCWGKNGHGQLGDGNGGTGNESKVPVDVVGLGSQVTAVTSGYQFTCAIHNGQAKCWGNNAGGALGANEADSFESDVPVDVTGLLGMSKISSSSAHSCALTIAGAVKCWGENGSGELGNDSTTGSNVPVNVIRMP